MTEVLRLGRVGNTCTGSCAHQRAHHRRQQKASLYNISRQAGQSHEAVSRAPCAEDSFKGSFRRCFLRTRGPQTIARLSVPRHIPGAHSWTFSMSDDSSPGPIDDVTLLRLSVAARREEYSELSELWRHLDTNNWQPATDNRQLTTDTLLRSPGACPITAGGIACLMHLVLFGETAILAGPKAGPRLERMWIV